MPKIVSRAVVSSSEQAALTQSARAVLRSYYCLCGDFVLVLQGKLDRLPRRRYAFSLLIISASTSSVHADIFGQNRRGLHHSL